MPPFRRAPVRPDDADELELITLETVRVNDTGVEDTRRSVSVKLFRERLPDGSFISMVSVPAGTFAMGSAHHKGHRDEEPLHYVKVGSFFLSQTTVTQSQWKAVMKRLPPCRGKGLDFPVDRVSWFDANAFCERLSKTARKPYRLPSEAEWEYACRADSNTDFAFGNMMTTDYANYVGVHRYLDGPTGVYRHGPIPSGSFPPNSFGLYDMHGNLWEWCADTWHEDYVGASLNAEPWVRGGTEERVLRGGSWHDPPDLCRSSSRLKLKPTEGEDFVGVRIALSMEIERPTRSN